MEGPFYFQVEQMFKEKSTYPIYNSTLEHSQYIINKIFQKARNKVTIYAGGNDFALYNNEEVKNAIKSKKLNLSVIVGTEKDAGNFSQIFPKDSIKILKRDFNFDLKYFVLDLDYQNTRHFLVADKKYTRIEKSHAYNSNKIQSIAFVNNKPLAKLLTKFGEYLTTYKE